MRGSRIGPALRGSRTARARLPPVALATASSSSSVGGALVEEEADVARRHAVGERRRRSVERCAGVAGGVVSECADQACLDEAAPSAGGVRGVDDAVEQGDGCLYVGVVRAARPGLRGAGR